MNLRALSSLGTGLCVAAALAPRVYAEEGADYSGRFGFVSVARNNLGDLGQDYRTGLLFGVYAGLEVGAEDSPWSAGIGWATLVRGYYFASREAVVDQTVNITEMNLGVLARRALPGKSHFLMATLGGTFSASNVPLPPVDERRYVGGYTGVGYGRRLLGEWVWTVESRYSSYFSGPQNVNLYFSVMAGFGK